LPQGSGNRLQLLPPSPASELFGEARGTGAGITHSKGDWSSAYYPWGNGGGLTEPQKMLPSALGSRWSAEYVIACGARIKRGLRHADTMNKRYPTIHDILTRPREAGYISV